MEWWFQLRKQRVLRVVAVVILLFYHFLSFSQSDTTGERSKWYEPDYIKAQFAGEIGLLSAGVGSELFKKGNGELDLMAGYLPFNVGGDDIFTTAIKFNYIPWSIRIKTSPVQWQPVSAGLLLFHAWGNDLNKLRDRDLYPRGYYWWPLGTRFGPVFGTRLSHDFDEDAKIKRAALIVEFVTNDLLIYSWGVNNELIPLGAIFSFSAGVRMDF